MNALLTSDSVPEVVEFRPRVRWRPGMGLVLLVLSGLAASWPAYIAGRISQGAITQIGPIEVRPTHSVDFFVLAFLVAVTPFAFYHYVRRRTRVNIENRLPDYLNDLAALHKAGLTLAESIRTAATGNYGPLTPHAKIAAEQIAWNLPVLKVLENLRDRLGTPIAARSLTVVIEAGRTGGNVPEVLGITAANARAFVNMRESRQKSMSMYTIITYVASAVFIGVAISLQAIFVPRMIEAFASTGAASLGSVGFKALPPRDSFRTLFYVAAVVQAIGNGLVGGIMSDGRLVGGLRHACIMTAIVFVGFAFAR